MRCWKAGMLVVLSIVLSSIEAWGGKPSKPPAPPPPAVDGGTIYVELDGALHGMEGNGDNRVAVATGVHGEPSRGLHWCAVDEAYERWFLDVRPVGTSSYPNGVYRHEIFAVCESGVACQLTDAADVEPDHTVPAAYGDQPSLWHPRPQWADGDTRVSYVAKRWSGGEVVEWGFYVLTVDPDYLDGHTVAAPSWIEVELDRMVPEGDTWSGGRVNATNAWAPDGAAFVYSSYLSTGRSVMRADYDASSDSWSTTELAEDGIAHCWAPVADRILFKQGGAVGTMDPYYPADVTMLPIEGTSTNRATTTVNFPCWSPSGTHVAYQVTTTTSKGAVSIDVYVAFADGSGRTNITDDTGANAEIVRWVGD